MEYIIQQVESGKYQRHKAKKDNKHANDVNNDIINPFVS